MFQIPTEQENITLRPIVRNEIPELNPMLVGGPDWTNFGIFEDGSPVGVTRLHLRDEPGSVELGYEITGRRKGKGFATVAAKAITSYAEDELGYERVIAKIDPINIASQKVAKKSGFVETGKEGSFLVYIHQAPQKSN